MRSLEENGYRELARLLQEWSAAHAPEWTNANDADPGIALLELLAFIAEALEARGDPIPERARLSAARLARSALALAGGNVTAQGCALARNRYYAGRLLGAEDFQLEQDYFRERLRRHNRELHGVGIVRGLQVSVEAVGGNARVVVRPGFAIGPDGEEIEVRCATSAGLPGAGSRLFVTLSADERLTHPAPASDDEQVQFTRVEETFALRVETTAMEKGVALACLIRTSTGWKVDEALPAPCVECHQR